MMQDATVLTGMIEADDKPVLFSTGWVGETWPVQYFRDLLAEHGIDWKKSFAVFAIWKTDRGFVRRRFCGAVR
jgi:hypothetical protein